MSFLYKQLRHSLCPLREKYELFLGHYFPKRLHSIHYRQAYGKNLDWMHPKTIDEKISWMVFNYDTTIWTELADKYRVRLYVIDRGLDDILVPLYGKWDNVSEIDWDALPQQFVIKTNHGSGDLLVCRDKKPLDVAPIGWKIKSDDSDELHDALLHLTHNPDEIRRIKEDKVSWERLR